MFGSLKLSKPSMDVGGPLSYARNLPIFADGRSFVFEPGLNILFGQNGSGKSTILNLLAFRLAALQGGVSTQTEDWLHKLFPHSMEGLGSSPSARRLWKATECFSVAHDGQPVVYCSPREDKGVSGGHFDDDFFEMGLLNVMSRGSTGQKTLRKLGGILNLLRQEISPKDFYAPGEDPVSKLEKKIAEREKTKKQKEKETGRTIRSSFWEERKRKDADEEAMRKAHEKMKKDVRLSFPSGIERRIKRNSVNSVWQSFFDGGEEFLSGNMPKGQPTIILDEPESGLSPLMQERLWSILSAPSSAKKYQIIVASHSPFALGIPHANMIEMSPGYASESLDVFVRKFSALKPA